MSKMSENVQVLIGAARYEDGKPTYVYNFLVMDSYAITSDTALPKGKSTVKLDFAIDDKKKLGSGGVATLYINDKKSRFWLSRKVSLWSLVVR